MQSAKEPDESVKALAEVQKTIDSKSSVDHIDVESHSGFRIRTRIIPAGTTQKFLQNVNFYPLKDVQSHTEKTSSIRVGDKPTTNWSTVGIVDKCYENPDVLFSVRLTDMRGTYTYLYITGKAYSTFRAKIKHGTVLALKRPFLLKPNNNNQPVALHVDQKQQTCAVGYSLDLKQCSAYNSAKARCNEYIDGRAVEYCNKHLKRALNFSKGRRAEMMSSTTGYEIRWASKKRQADGTLVYESHQSKTPQQTYNSFFRDDRREAYLLKGIGYVGTDGSIFEQKQRARKPFGEEDRNILEKSLKGKRDPGAKNIRKALGLKEETQKDVLSNDQLSRLGQQAACSPEEEQQKKRLIEALTKRRRVEKDGAQEEKPRYVYL